MVSTNVVQIMVQYCRLALGRSRHIATCQTIITFDILVLPHWAVRSCTCCQIYTAMMKVAGIHLCGSDVGTVAALAALATTLFRP